MQYVLLTDDEDGTTLIACPDSSVAEAVGSAAVFNDGGVSAWLMLNAAIVDHQKVIDILKGGGKVQDLSEADLSAVSITITQGGASGKTE